ncbi:MAG: TetR/AcrR family transcriptional regulator [Symploca sp. SIO1B1]|nr:TetR/AcrR family transcriptional regulator [Symploca sp. SIO2D2]NER25496.1 TetR/AcrR family transcriptional regulator [Symploca sp. SIO1C2]NES00044.1 TetR/AcrR family transcriptional regulator [Symploca sp. SIO1B1]
MARHKEFDRQIVLEKAMETFWQYGYEGTSIQILLQAMGINRGSLYDTFGDKRSLFLEAIAHYESKVVQEAMAKLEAPDAGKAAIIEHFQGMVERLASDRTRWGCFMTNVAVELCNHDTETAHRIRQSLQRVEKAFRHALQNAQSQGDIASDADIAALACFLTCMIQGLRVMVKVDPNRQALNQIINSTLSVLDNINQPRVENTFGG